MKMLRGRLASFAALTFLIQVLPVQAETNTTTPGTISPTKSTSSTSTTPTPTVIPVETIACDEIDLNMQTTGVQNRFEQSSELLTGKQCVILEADSIEDLSTVFARIPANTVVVLSSDSVSASISPTFDLMSSTEMADFSSTIMTASASPSATPLLSPSPSPSVLPKQQTEYFIGSELFIKNGQHLLGAPDEGFEIVIRDLPNFTDRHMVKIGRPDSFTFNEQNDSTISNITFLPTRDNKRRSIDSLYFAECSNRTLTIEDTVNYLDTRASLFFDCKMTLDASADPARTGPGVYFADNIIIGRKDDTSQQIPDEGLFISLPSIRNLRDNLKVVNNRFMGDMAEAAEINLGQGSTIELFRNQVNISNVGKARKDAVSPQRGAFLLKGISKGDATRPEFFLAGNSLNVTATAISVVNTLELTLSCNQLKASSPWRQNSSVLPLVAADPYELIYECGDPMSTTAIMMPTPTPGSSSRVINQWQAAPDSTATACEGLMNLQGQLFFDSETCQPVVPTDPPTTSTSSSTSLTTLFTSSTSQYSSMPVTPVGATPSQTTTPSVTPDSPSSAGVIIPVLSIILFAFVTALFTI